MLISVASQSASDFIIDKRAAMRASDTCFLYSKFQNCFCIIILESTSYTFGNGGGLVTYERPKGKYFDTTQDQFALGFTTSQLNAFLFRVESNTSKDFIELSLVINKLMLKDKVYNLHST